MRGRPKRRQCCARQARLLGQKVPRSPTCLRTCPLPCHGRGLPSLVELAHRPGGCSRHHCQPRLRGAGLDFEKAGWGAAGRPDVPLLQGTTYRPAFCPGQIATSQGRRVCVCVPVPRGAGHTPCLPVCPLLLPLLGCLKGEPSPQNPHPFSAFILLRPAFFFSVLLCAMTSGRRHPLQGWPGGGQRGGPTRSQARL